MSDLFNRDFALTVGAVKIPARQEDPRKDVARPMLRVVFNVERDDNRDPNKAEVTIYNLNSAHRKLMQENWPVIIEAGYLGNIQQLFSGTIKTQESHREGVDWITNVEAVDGLNKIQSARMNVSFGPGTTLFALLTYAATALGVGPGNSLEKFARPLRGKVLFKKGVTLSGKVSKILDKYVSTVGATWSIQDGQLQVLAGYETTLESVVNLTEFTGMIGSPEVGEKGIVTAKSLLQGGIKPGRRIVIGAENVIGTYKVIKVTHSGDSWGQDWYTDFEAMPTGLV